MDCAYFLSQYRGFPRSPPFTVVIHLTDEELGFDVPQSGGLLEQRQSPGIVPVSSAAQPSQ